MESELPVIGGMQANRRQLIDMLWAPVRGLGEGTFKALPTLGVSDEGLDPGQHPLPLNCPKSFGFEPICAQAPSVTLASGSSNLLDSARHPLSLG